jgi:hypothetical protein
MCDIFMITIGKPSMRTGELYSRHGRDIVSKNHLTLLVQLRGALANPSVSTGIHLKRDMHNFRDLAPHCVFVAAAEARPRCGIKSF